MNTFNQIINVCNRIMGMETYPYPFLLLRNYGETNGFHQKSLLIEIISHRRYGSTTTQYNALNRTCRRCQFTSRQINSSTEAMDNFLQLLLSLESNELIKNRDKI